MSTCKECFHYEACLSIMDAANVTMDSDAPNAENLCDHFVDRTACLVALNKQTTRLVVTTGKGCLCPACRFDMMGVWDVPEAEDPKHCPNCGQALDWGNKNAKPRPQMAYYKNNPNLSGPIKRWLSENQFLVSYQDDHVILAHRDFWEVIEVR